MNDALDYTIRFENLGNYTAFNVVIKDTLDSQLDLKTLEVISSSHYVETTIDRDRVLTFRFPDINLEPSKDNPAKGQGYVKYSIQPLSDLPDHSTINNTASIYFDQNEAVITNTTENILVEVIPASLEDQGQSNHQVDLYPNPTSGKVFFQSDVTRLANVKLISIEGRVLESLKIQNESQLNLDMYCAGLYLLSFEFDDGTVINHKVLVE